MDHVRSEWSTISSPSGQSPTRCHTSQTTSKPPLTSSRKVCKHQPDTSMTQQQVCMLITAKPSSMCIICGKHGPKEGYNRHASTLADKHSLTAYSQVVCHIACLMLAAGSSLAVHYSGERKLQQWFNTSTYVTLEPNSYSRRILNDQVQCSTPRQMLMLTRPAPTFMLAFLYNHTKVCSLQMHVHSPSSCPRY